MNSLTPFQQYFKDEGLKEPYIPTDELSNIKDVDDSQRVVGTREIPQSLYDIEAFAAELFSKSTKDYVLIGRGGVGMQPPIHYYAVKGHLAVFVQLASKDPSYIDGHLKAIELLFERMADIETTLSPNTRLVVVQSDIRSESNRWGWMSSGQQKIDWHAKQPQKAVMFDALLELVKMKKK